MNLESLGDHASSSSVRQPAATGKNRWREATGFSAQRAWRLGPVICAVSCRSWPWPTWVRCLGSRNCSCGCLHGARATVGRAWAKGHPRSTRNVCAGQATTRDDARSCLGVWLCRASGRQLGGEERRWCERCVTARGCVRVSRPGSGAFDFWRTVDCFDAPSRLSACVFSCRRFVARGTECLAQFFARVWRWDLRRPWNHQGLSREQCASWLGGPLAAADSNRGTRLLPVARRRSRVVLLDHSSNLPSMAAVAQIAETIGVDLGWGERGASAVADCCVSMGWMNEHWTPWPLRRVRDIL